MGLVLEHEHTVQASAVNNSVGQTPAKSAGKSVKTFLVHCLHGTAKHLLLIRNALSVFRLPSRELDG
jgi:hypothetical protein